MVKIKNLIVGCGFSGVTVARKIAEDFGEKVVVIDAREHIAGNCYDYWDGNRICVHRYGTHIFHTNLKKFGILLVDLLNGILISIKLKVL
ncbi:hypothetical protein AGMMS49921_09980 [Endomicrobiia bacterium]|nr:hypothetical protein AGMMS49921_09980 [Endomicrobiia bacterium]